MDSCTQFLMSLIVQVRYVLNSCHTNFIDRCERQVDDPIVSQSVPFLSLPLSSHTHFETSPGHPRCVPQHHWRPRWGTYHPDVHYLTLNQCPIASTLSSQPDYTKSGLLIISRGTAILLLIVYIAYLFFQVYLIIMHPRRVELILIMWRLTVKDS
jgi:hypothetical protein